MQRQEKVLSSAGYESPQRNYKMHLYFHFLIIFYEAVNFILSKTYAVITLSNLLANTFSFISNWLLFMSMDSKCKTENTKKQRKQSKEEAK